MRYSDRVDFRLVYVREAHPSDGWRESLNDEEDIDVPQPKSYAQRVAVAGRLCSSLKTSIPVYVDSIKDEVSEAYAAFPERLYVIDVNGRVAFKGGRGPIGFDPHELDQAILLTLLAGKERGAP